MFFGDRVRESEPTVAGTTLTGLNVIVGDTEVWIHSCHGACQRELKARSWIKLAVDCFVPSL